MTVPWQTVFERYSSKSWDFDTARADRFTYKIGTVRLSTNTRFQVRQTGVTVFVGANNVGKSTLLRQIRDRFFGYPEVAEFPTEPTLVAAADHVQAGDEADAAKWIGERFAVMYDPAGTPIDFRRHDGYQFSPASLFEWDQEPVAKAGVAAAVTFYGNAQGRFDLHAAAPARDGFREGPAHPVHSLQDSPELFAELKELTKTILGVSLTLDTLGPTIRLRVGELSEEPPRVDEVSVDYRAAMESLPPLDVQGDGMRSLMGQLLPLVSGVYRVVLLDEPEAFLHPPQAHALGLELGRLSERHDIQVLLATHDKNLLAGLLDSKAPLDLVQVQRTSDVNKIHLSHGQSLRTIWDDPATQYSNILESLFHRVAIVAEGDSDCRFYQASMEALDDSRRFFPNNEIHFSSVGGKAAMPKAVKALASLGVPAVIAADLDVLSDRKKLKVMVEAMSEEWTSELESLWISATAEFRNQGNRPKVQKIADDLNHLLGPHMNDQFDSALKRQIDGVLRAAGSRWGNLKLYGVAAFRGGRASVMRLLDALDEIGIVLVHEGELEQLVPALGVAKGPEWVAKALQSGGQSEKPAADFAKRLMRACLDKVSDQAARAEILTM